MEAAQHPHIHQPALEVLRAQNALENLKIQEQSKELSVIIDFVREQTGIQMTQARAFQTFNGNFLEKVGLSSFDELVNAIRMKSSRVIPHVIDKATVNESSFFRDKLKDVWKDFLLPHIQSLRKNRVSSPKVHIWSAAASTGQEAYSVSMLANMAGVPSSELSILGTDISETVLQHATLGRYNKFQSERGLSEDERRTFFTSQLGINGFQEYQVRDEIKQPIQFKKKNLLALKPFEFPTKMDIVFLRQVLIYFDKETKRRVIENVCANMQLGSLLITTLTEEQSIRELMAGKFEKIGPEVFRKIA